MPVHVVIKRKLKINDPEKLTPLLSELSERAQLQKGYISTDILQHVDNPGEYLVVSRWETEENWKAWLQSKERRDIQGRVDSLIGERTFYEIFKPVSPAS
jgi:heme-degrading monooxygenase HmoA